MIPRVKIIASECAGLVGVGVGDLIERDPRQHISAARQLAMWRARSEIKLSFRQIGNSLNRRNHTTIIHGCKRVHAKIAELGSLEAVEDWVTSLKPKLPPAKPPKPAPARKPVFFTLSWCE